MTATTDDDGELVTRWAVAVTAWDADDNRSVCVYTADAPLYLTDPGEAIRFSNAVAQATVWALKANGQLPGNPASTCAGRGFLLNLKERTRGWHRRIRSPARRLVGPGRSRI